jgi:hypothetical protein
MRVSLFIFLYFSLVNCGHFSQERSLSQVPRNREIESFGNFFQKVKIKSSKQMDHQSQFDDILGKKINVDYNIIDLPEDSGASTLLEKKGWSIETVELNTESNARYSNYILDIKLGQISEKQFNEIRAIMKSPEDLQWESKKQYSIVDFMPISVQALFGNYYIHNRFTYDKKTLPWHYQFKEISNEGQVSRISNCWHAAWEYLHAANDKVSIFFADEQHIRPILEDSQRSTLIKEFNPTQIEILYTSPRKFFKDIKPGDLILIYQKIQSMAQGEFEALAHVAVAVDNNIVFEKMNPASKFPYRLAYLTDTIDNLIYSDKPNINDKTTVEYLNSLRIVIRRFETKLPVIRNLINMEKNPGIFIDITQLKEKERPSKEFMMNHTIVAELGSGGTIISEDLYKIQDIKILHADGKYFFENSFTYP